MIIIKARFDGRAFIPEQPVDLPVGQILEITITPPAGVSNSPSTLRGLAELMDTLPANSAWPADGAAQHDHYLYGTPKTP
jgi:hypothetical protein